MRSIIVILLLGLLFLGGIGFYILFSQNTSKVSNTVLSTSSFKTYTVSEVAIHKDASSCWTAINGKVYDVTDWINRHPGGANRILSSCGINGSDAFNGQHAGQGQAASYLFSYQIGILSQ